MDHSFLLLPGVSKTQTYEPTSISARIIATDSISSIVDVQRPKRQGTLVGYNGIATAFRGKYGFSV